MMMMNSDWAVILIPLFTFLFILALVVPFAILIHTANFIEDLGKSKITTKKQFIGRLFIVPALIQKYKGLNDD